LYNLAGKNPASIFIDAGFFVPKENIFSFDATL